MITMMEHPKHGRHPATGHEVEPLKAQGWTVCPPKNVPPEQVEDAALENAAPPRQKRSYNRRQV